jgi:myo-inositol-1(or 4)-monophosphatase
VNDTDWMREVLLGAGKLALGHFGRVAASMKQDSTYVTAADVAVQRFVRRRIEARFPRDGILAEEEGLRRDPDAGPGGRTWVVDPIDGTAAFVAGLPVWGISIALVEGGRPAAGYFHLPATGDLFLTAPDGGVLRNGARAALKPHSPFHPETSVMVDARFHARHTVAPSYPGKLRSMGSTAAHLCYVAAGCADAAVAEHAYAWDLAAGVALVRAGGGVVRYMDGSDVDLAPLMAARQPAPPVLAGSAEAVARVAEILRGPPRE